MTMMRQFNLAFLKTYFGFSNSETAISKCQFITHRESKSVSGEWPKKKPCEPTKFGSVYSLGYTFTLRLQVAGQMKLVSGTLKTWKVVYVLVIINFRFVSSYMYTYMQLLCVGITRYPRAVWDMETSVLPVSSSFTRRSTWRRLAFISEVQVLPWLYTRSRGSLYLSLLS